MFWVWSRVAQLQQKDWNPSYFKSSVLNTLLMLTKQYNLGVGVTAKPLMQSIGVELLISMLLLLHLATCRNDTFPKQSCQNFWTLYLKVYSSLLLRVITFRMQTRLFRDYLAWGWKSGRWGFPLVRRGCLALGKLGCRSPWIRPLLTVHQSRSEFKLADRKNKKIK